MLETPKALDTITFKILLVTILKDISMDNQQETNKIKSKDTNLALKNDFK
jgi:hypothetical protein